MSGVRTKLADLNFKNAQAHSVGPDSNGIILALYDPKTHEGFTDAKFIAAFDPPTALRIIAAARRAEPAAPAPGGGGAFEIGSRVQPKGGGLVVGELMEFNSDQTGALIHWDNGAEIWKNLKNLEVIAPIPDVSAEPGQGGEGAEPAAGKLRAAVAAYRGLYPSTPDGLVTLRLSEADVILAALSRTPGRRGAASATDDP